MTDETKCPVPNCHAGMLRDHNGRDSISCPVCDGTLKPEEYAALSPSPRAAPPGPPSSPDRCQCGAVTLWRNPSPEASATDPLTWIVHTRKRCARAAPETTRAASRLAGTIYAKCPLCNQPTEGAKVEHNIAEGAASDAQAKVVAADERERAAWRALELIRTRKV